MAKEKKITSGLSIDYIIHPGNTLQEILNDRRISQKDLALSTGVSPKHISEIIAGKKDISISFAKKLQYALGTEAMFWINLQSIYDREIYEYNELKSITKDELNILNIYKSNGVLSDLAKLRMIDCNESKYVQVLYLRSILKVSNLCLIPSQSYAAAYRIRKNVNLYVLYAWQRMCETICENEIINNELNVEKLKNSIDKIKKTMFLDASDMQDELKKIFAECGIVFNIVHNYKGAPVQGYIKQLQGNRLLLCMTIRGKFIDIFWFTLFHEIAHIINGDTKNYYIDFDNEDNDKENKADAYARNQLINHDDYLKFIDQNDLSFNSIKVFANKCNVEPSIVIGRLLKDDIIDYQSYSKYRKKYEWVI